MRRVYQTELEQVKAYLDKNNKRGLYIDFQSKVKDELTSHFSNPLHFPIIQEIRSREFYDPDVRIKADKKIALKLYQWNRLSDDIDYKPSDVHDIAALTIICSYPSEIKIISKEILSKYKAKYYTVTEDESEYKDPAKWNGYQAYHFKLRGTGVYQGLYCELQVKTLLAMSWSRKTHDLTYKPPGGIHKKLTRQMNKLTHMAQLIDDQSEILRDLITESWELGSVRRDLARKQMLEEALITDISENVKELISKIEASQDSLAVLSLEHPDAKEILDFVGIYLNENGPTEEICRVAVIFAVIRACDDRNDWAIELLDDFIEYQQAQGLEDKNHRGLQLRSVYCLALGEYDEAITSGSECMARAVESEDPIFIATSKSNLAYFLSEAYFHRAFDLRPGGGKLLTEETDGCAKKAMDLVCEVLKISPVPSYVMDSIGSVYITCGENETVIREGLEMCKRAKEEAKNEWWEESAKAFYVLHENRAFRRLSELGIPKD